MRLCVGRLIWACVIRGFLPAIRINANPWSAAAHVVGTDAQQPGHVNRLPPQNHEWLLGLWFSGEFSEWHVAAMATMATMATVSTTATMDTIATMATVSTMATIATIATVSTMDPVITVANMPTV